MPENRARRNSTRWRSAFRKIDPEFPILVGRNARAAGGLCRSIRRFFHGSGKFGKKRRLKKIGEAV